MLNNKHDLPFFKIWVLKHQQAPVPLVLSFLSSFPPIHLPSGASIGIHAATYKNSRGLFSLAALAAKHEEVPLPV